MTDLMDSKYFNLRYTDAMKMTGLAYPEFCQMILDPDCPSPTPIPGETQSCWNANEFINWWNQKRCHIISPKEEKRGMDRIEKRRQYLVKTDSAGNDIEISWWLEARWIRFFELLGFKWEYKKEFDTAITFYADGSDRKIHASMVSSTTPDGIIKAPRTRKFAEEVKIRGSDNDAHIALGTTPFISVDYVQPTYWSHSQPSGIWIDTQDPLMDSFITPFGFSCCRDCGQNGVYSQSHSYRMIPCGDYEGDSCMSDIDDLVKIWYRAKREQPFV